MRPDLLCALLAALLLRMLVPAGFMLDRGTLVPCDGVAAAPAVHHHGHGESHQPAEHRQTACPYAALAAPVLPPLPPVTPVTQAAAVEAAPAAALAGLLSPGAAAPPPPATGPPLAA